MDDLSRYPNMRIVGGRSTMIYPGTELEQIAKDEGILPRDFSWNSPYYSQRNKAYQLWPTVPYFEHIKFDELIPFFDRKRRKTLRKGAVLILRQGLKELIHIRTAKDFQSLYQKAKALVIANGRKRLASIYSRNPARRKITRAKLDKFLSEHASEKKTLDIGRGNSPYARYFPNSIGMDVVRCKDIEVMADAHVLPFKDESFEVILATEVLEHLKEPQKAIDEMRRVLKPGGKSVLSTRFIFPLHETPHDYYRFTKYGLEYLFKDWDIIEIQEETDTMGSLAVLIQRIAFQCDILNFRPFKAFFHIGAHIMKHLGFIITKEYGVFYRNIPEKTILTSGYYVVAVKPNHQGPKQPEGILNTDKQLRY